MERYNEYKDSGVQWLGEIPSHWETRPLKYSCSLKGRIGWNGLRSEEFQDTAFAYLVTGQDFIGSEIDWSKCYQISRERYDEDPFIQLNNGDMLITKDGTIGKVAKVTNLDKPACLNSGIFVIKQKGSFFNQGFLYWMLCSNVLKEFNVYTQTGATIAHLYQNVFENMPCLLPPISEQQAIATYLDTVTSKIDEAIAQQQKMIDLLNERKQIIINNAVTKGLNPDAPMKDSGVDWIGEIPEHWEVSRIKNVITLLTDYDANGSFSDIAKNCNINNGTPYAWMVRTTDLVNNRVGIVEGNNYCDKKTYDYLAKSSLESGDLLMTKRGNVGMVYVVPECSCPMTLAPNLYLLKTKASDINNRYLMHYLSSTKPKSQLAILNKSTTLGALYKDDVKSLQIVLPPIDEQLLLAQFIDKELDKVDSVISNCNRQISLLQERKQIIINDVVTGKVKVS